MNHDDEKPEPALAHVHDAEGGDFYLHRGPLFLVHRTELVCLESLLNVRAEAMLACLPRLRASSLFSLPSFPFNAGGAIAFPPLCLPLRVVFVQHSWVTVEVSPPPTQPYRRVCGKLMCKQTYIRVLVSEVQ